MATLLVSIMTVKSPTSSVDALPDGLIVVLVCLQIIDIILQRQLELYLPFIQPGNTVDNSVFVHINDFLIFVFHSFYSAIRKETTDWKENKTTHFYFINPQSETLISDTPIIKRLLEFFMEFFHCV